MSRIGNDTVATLRRRVRELNADGYNDQYVKVFERAAENLETHQRFLVSGEQFTLETVAANRLLRNALDQASNMIRRLGGKRHEGLQLIHGTLHATKEPGVGRHILVMEVTAGKTREQLEAELRVVLDAYFTKGDSDEAETESDTVDGPDSAGDARASSRARDTSQQAARRVP